FQEDYPNIDYELLLGDYTEIESWITEGRVDCGFLKLPTLPEFEAIFLEDDQLMAVLPEHHRQIRWSLRRRYLIRPTLRVLQKS
ncbi:LysR family transcriptional regulator substrate-binding protein, partial [Anaerostipes caccae]|uniref:LysR family transcriptional regulator substrate-binding protein n=1 Tax=Anaerostipes caccae TaxID=105841 RepID=UPI00210C7B83